MKGEDARRRGEVERREGRRGDTYRDLNPLPVVTKSSSR